MSSEYSRVTLNTIGASGSNDNPVVRFRASPTLGRFRGNPDGYHCSTASRWSPLRARSLEDGTSVFTSLFREEAVASRNQRQQLDRLLRITAPHERVVLAGIGLVVLAFLGWALFGSVEREVRADGILVEPGARHEVVSTDSGYILEFLVAPGDRVEAGDPIARQNVPDLEREIDALRGRVELLEVEALRAGGGGDALRSQLASARVALAQMEARRSARALIVSAIAGEVTTLHATPGDWLPAGAGVARLRDIETQPVQVVLRVAPDRAQRIRPGMRASVEVGMPDGAIRSLSAEVAAVTSEPLPDWLAALAPAHDDSGHRVDIALSEPPGFPIPEGTPCRVHIVVGRHPPIALFGHGRS